MDIKPIRTKRDYRRALREIEGLMEAKRGTPEGDRLDVLVTLVEAWEARHYPLDLPDPVPCPVPAGSVIFHHGCCLHASADNDTDTWRKALILHFSTSEASSRRPELNEQVSLEID